MSTTIDVTGLNRVTAAIHTSNKQLIERLKNGLVTQEKLDSLHKTLDVEFDEYCKFQELKTLAVAHNKLSLDEGMTIYSLLGNVPEQFNRQSLAVKITLTKIFAELLEWSIRNK